MFIDDSIAGSIGDLIWRTDADLRPIEVVGGADFDPTVRDYLVAADTICDWVDPDTTAAFDARETLNDHKAAVPRGFQTVTITANPIIEDGAFVGYAGVLRATELASDQAQRLKTVMAQRDLFQSALEASPVNVTIADMTQPGAPLIYVNEAFCTTTGYSREEAVGRNCRFLQGDETDAGSIQRIRDALAYEKPLDIELMNYRKDGTAFWNALSLAPVYDDKGDVIAVLGIQRDVSADRRAQQEELARQRMESLGRLASGVAHEINNMMQPSFVYADALAEDLTGDHAEAAEHAKAIKEGARAVRQLVREILTFAKADDEALAARDLTQELNEAVQFARSMMPTGVEVHLRQFCKTETFPTLLRESDLRRVILNLCVNAAYAMRNNGKVSITLTCTKNRATIDVTDTGTGIPADHAGKIFEPFFTTKPRGVGTGLGLSIVHTVITTLGGTIDVAATGPLGTTFRLTLWRSEGESEIAA